LWVNHLMFKKGPITYVDIAANDATMISNTFFFDWCPAHPTRGICVEANPKHYYRLWRDRKCSLVPTCASSSRMHVNFTQRSDGRAGNDGEAGILGTAKTMQTLGEVRQLTCEPLSTVFAKYGVTHVDFMSLDVEGAEQLVLAGVDFTRVEIDMIVAEIDSPDRKANQALRGMLRSRGYRKIASMGGDEIYARSGFEPLRKKHVHYSPCSTDCAAPPCRMVAG